jgi:hypothetical protein
MQKGFSGTLWQPQTDSPRQISRLGDSPVAAAKEKETGKTGLLVNNSGSMVLGLGQAYLVRKNLAVPVAAAS